MKKIIFIIFVTILIHITAAAKLPQDIISLCGNVKNAPKDKINAILQEWRDSKSVFPEIINNQATFLYYSETDREIAGVVLSGTFNNFSSTQKMTRVKGTNLFYKQIKFNDKKPVKYYFDVLFTDGTSKRERDYFNNAIIYDRDNFNTLIDPENRRGSIHIMPSLTPQSPAISKRDILVYLPPGYYKDPARRYPVLYMHDGQQIFDSPAAAHNGWKIDTIADQLISAGTIEPLIVVGVYNSSRRDDELMGWSKYHQEHQLDVKSKIDDRKIVVERGSAYVEYLINKIKPLIDTEYRTKPEGQFTGTGGASSGAMEALYLGFKHPDIFSRIAALSGGFAYYDDLAAEFMIPPGKLRIYLSCGDMDLDKLLLPATVRMYDTLLKKGYKDGSDLKYEFISKAGHTETAWSKRTAVFLEYLFPANHKN